MKKCIYCLINKKIKYSQLFNFFVNMILLFGTIVSLYLPNKISSLQTIGIWILVVSFTMLYRYKNNTNICLLIGMVMIISICFSLSVCLNTENTAFNWQIPLINESANIINAKNYLLFLTVFSIFIGSIKENKIVYTTYKYNSIIVFFGFIVLIYSLIFGFDRGSVGTYSSNTNVLYEYAIIIYIIVWEYSTKKKYIKILLIIYAVVYCLQGLIFGDRSSAFPMILLLFLLLYKKSYTMKHIIIVGLLGIFFANCIDIFRNTGDIFDLETLNEVVDRGLFVNTISYSFYGGTQIIRYGIAYPLKITHHFTSYISSFIFGGSSEYSLTTLANLFGFTNKGGGMTHTYFFYWGGFLGTILGAILIARLINYIFNMDTKYTNILQITITIFLIRWFIYYPVAFFRTAIIIPSVCYLLCEFFNRIILSKQHTFIKKGGK